MQKYYDTETHSKTISYRRRINMTRVKMKKLFSLLLALTMIVTGFTMVPENVQAASAKITLNKTKATVYVGKSTTISVKKVTGLSSKSVSYKSSNTKVAKVTSKGKVTGVKKGTATITVTSKKNKKVTAKAKITVKQPVKSITTAKEVTLQKGKSFTIQATVLPSDANDKKLTYSSSKKSVATVNSKGKITAKKAGTATITVKSKDGQKKTTIKVTVKNKVTAVTSIKLNKTKATLDVKKTTTLKATVNPSKATEKDVYWLSSKPSVATVNAKGKVTAVSAGTATITAYATDASGKKASCKITVETPVTSVKVSPASVSMNIGETKTVTATVAPSNATKKTVTWSTSNAAIATVNGGTITGVAAGTATITAKTSNGKSATVAVTVNAPTPEPVVPATVAVSVDMSTLVIGETTKAYADVTPANAVDKTVTWVSGNEAVASVDADGTITAKGTGTATISAATTNGKTGSVTVTVTNMKYTDSNINAAFVGNTTYKVEGIGDGSFTINAEEIQKLHAAFDRNFDNVQSADDAFKKITEANINKLNNKITGFNANWISDTSNVKTFEITYQTRTVTVTASLLNGAITGTVNNGRNSYTYAVSDVAAENGTTTFTVTMGGQSAVVAVTETTVTVTKGGDVVFQGQTKGGIYSLSADRTFAGEIYTKVTNKNDFNTVLGTITFTAQ